MKFDLATISGVIIATVGLVVGLRSEGLQFSDMSQLTAIFVVFFGTAGAVLISMPVEQTKKALRMLPGMIRNPNELDRDVIELILRYAKAARLGGLLSLETEIRAIEDPYLRSAMQLAVDSVNVESIKVVLESEVAGLRAEAESAAVFYEAAAGYAPTLGMAGAAIGLIQVMKHLEHIDQADVVPDGPVQG